MEHSFTLKPLASVRTRAEFESILLNNEVLQQTILYEKELLSSHAKEFTVNGFCIPCNETVPFLVGEEWGGRIHNDILIPNWRERLECSKCEMNNRMRLVATTLKQEFCNKTGQNIYFMEQVTPIFKWAEAALKEHNLTGSEYIGFQYEGGTVINGLRHENIEKLSFPDETLNMIISNDVFEHVPDPVKGFRECARVLKKGGMMLATFPFYRNLEKSAVRARLKNGQPEHLAPAIYHGNPLSDEGSLVFTDFGWDIIPIIKTVGFSDVTIDIYASRDLCHLGGGQLIFRLTK